MNSFDVRVSSALISCSLLVAACASNEPAPKTPPVQEAAASNAAAQSLKAPQSAQVALELVLAKLEAHGLSKGAIVLEKLDSDRRAPRANQPERVSVTFDARFVAPSAVAATQQLDALLAELRQSKDVLECRTSKTVEVENGIRARNVLVAFDLAAQPKTQTPRPAAAEEISAAIRALAHTIGIGPVDIAHRTPVQVEKGLPEQELVIRPGREEAGYSLADARRFAEELERSDYGLTVTHLGLEQPKGSATGWRWKIDASHVLAE